MTHTPHELHDEFPDSGEAIRRLKLEDPHFARLADRYHDVNREIHRIEAEIETPSDDYTESLKKQRLALIDEISAVLAAARTA